MQGNSSKDPYNVQHVWSGRGSRCSRSESCRFCLLLQADALKWPLEAAKLSVPSMPPPAWTAVSSASGPRKWRSTNKHWPPTWPTCSTRSGCDADWCGSAADKLSGGIGTLAIAFQIRRWSSQTLMSIVSHYNWWSVVFGRAPERERDTVRDCWEISSMIYGTQREMETVGEWHL